MFNSKKYLNIFYCLKSYIYKDISLKNKNSFSSNDFHSYFDLLKQEFRSGLTHLNIYNQLEGCSHRYPDEFEKYSDFFSVTRYAHLELSHIILSRIFDRHKGYPVSFKTFLLAAQDNLSDFHNSHSKKVKKQIMKDLHWSSPKNNHDIDEITDLRNMKCTPFFGQ